MTPLFSYFIQGSLVTASLLLCYKLLLRKDTFFKWSRWYFMSAVAASFVVPLIDVSALFSKAAQPAVIQYLPDLSFTAYQSTSNPAETFLNSLLYAGMLAMFIRLLLQLHALVKLRRNKRIRISQSMRIVELDERVNPFSFFNEIYINPQLHTEAELAEIIQHEQFHIQQRHTIDILLGELLTIVFWFNPFAWMMKQELKQNLEFLTDKLVLATGIDAKHYQYNLLKVSGLQNNIAAANHFYFLKLKNRIMMMNKKQSHPYRAVKFLLPLPVVALLLMAFTERKDLMQTFNQMLHDSLPPATNGSVTINTRGTTLPNGEVQLPANVKQVLVSNKNGKRTITVTLKNGTTELYNLNDEADRQRMEQKYGPIDASPAPPVPPVPPAGAAVPVPPGPPTSVTVTLPRQEAVLNSKGYYLTVADDNGECVVIVKNKSKKIVTAVTLTDWEASKKAFEEKYGAIPPATPKTKTVTVTSGNNAGNSKPAGDFNSAGITFRKTDAQTSVETMSLDNTSALVIVDGVKKPKGNFNINSIDPNTIASINILKEQAATAVYGEEGKDGVIIITTKAKEPTTSISGTISDGSSMKVQGAEPLYVVEGKIVSSAELNKIKADEIKGVKVLKAEQAVLQFGEKGKNGAAIITLKK